MKGILVKIIKDEEGQAMVEYATLITLICVVAIVVFLILRDSILNLFKNTINLDWIN